MVDTSVTSCNVCGTVTQETAGSDGQWAFSPPMRHPRFVTKRLGKNFLCYTFLELSWGNYIIWFKNQFGNLEDSLSWFGRCSRGGRIPKNKPAMSSEVHWARWDVQPHFRQSVWQDCNAWDGLEKDLDFFKFISPFSMCFLNLFAARIKFCLTKEEPSKVRCAKLLHFDHSMSI